MELRDVDADAVLRMLDEGDTDHQNCWLGRAHASFGGGPVPQAFRDVLAAEIAKAAAGIGAAGADGGIVLHRGLSAEPDLSRIGRHWSDSRAVASDYGPYLATATVSADDVDWCATVLRRIGWPREREVTLRPEARVLVATVEHGQRIVAVDVEAAVSDQGPAPRLR